MKGGGGLWGKFCENMPFFWWSLHVYFVWANISFNFFDLTKK